MNDEDSQYKWFDSKKRPRLSFNLSFWKGGEKEKKEKSSCKISHSWIIPLITSAIGLVTYFLMLSPFTIDIAPFLLLMLAGGLISFATKHYMFLEPIIVGIYSLVAFDYSRFFLLYNIFLLVNPFAVIVEYLSVLAFLTFIVYLGATIGRVGRDIYEYFTCQKIV